MLKICRKCKVEKLLSEFHKHKRYKDGVRSICKQCRNYESQQYQRTKKGLVTQIYGSQRNSSKHRNMDLPNYSKEWLETYIFSHNDFNELYNKWVSSGFESDLKPSIDRLDDYMPYSKENIRLVTWKDNRDKWSLDKVGGVNNKQNKSVIQFKKDGEFIKEFHSIQEASRQTGIVYSSISETCHNKRKSAGGFKWKLKQ